jgi:uncharacterized protein YbjT (DUF2867 family)
MRGIEKVYLVSQGSDIEKLGGHVVDAAKRAGVRHVVKLSVLGADAPRFIFSGWHAASERRLMDSGLPWTMLRSGNFMTNSLGWAETIKSQGAFYQPTGEGGWAAIDPADVGAVAVAALTTTGHERRAYALTGPEALSASDHAATLSRVLGRPLRSVDVPPAAARESMLGMGIPPV